MENKKTKLTITGSPKKSYKNFGQSKILGKKTVIIEKHTNKQSNKGNYNRTSSSKLSTSNFKKNNPNHPYIKNVSDPRFKNFKFKFEDLIKD